MTLEGIPKRRLGGWQLARWAVGISLACLALAGGGLAALVVALTPPRVTPPPQADLVISDVTIINPGLSRITHQTIVVRRGRIVVVRAALPDDPAPICTDCFAMPGLIDAHVHTPPAVAIGNQRLFALLYLAHGVTSVRDAGQSDQSVATWARRLNNGEQAGPHVYRCGPVLDGRDPGWPSALSVTNPDEARITVRRLAREGVSCIKVYNHVDAATFAAITATAAQEGLPVMGHVPHLVGLRNLSDFDAQHLTGMPYLHREPPWGGDIELSALAAMSDDEIEEALSLAAARNVSFTPTIVIFPLRLVVTDPERFAPPPGARHMPDAWRRVWPSMNPYPTNEAEIETQLAATRRARDVVGRARARGVDVLAGTDTIVSYVVPGESLLLEIEELARAFDDNEAALAAATLVNGRHIDNGHIGLIAPGARADILLLPRDPVEDLRALRGWRVLVAAGRRYDREALDAALRSYDGHFHSGLYRNASGMMVRLVEGRYRQNSIPERN